MIRLIHPSFRFQKPSNVSDENCRVDSADYSFVTYRRLSLLKRNSSKCNHWVVRSHEESKNDINSKFSNKLNMEGLDDLKPEISGINENEFYTNLASEDDLNAEKNEYANILKISIPALGAVLSDPLMSLIDTACVGQIGSLQLAALGPNVSIFNFVFIAFTFLSAATCNFVAGSSGNAKNAKSRKLKELNASRFVSHGLLFAFLTGFFVSILLQVFATRLLFLMGAKNSFAEPALSYLRIRALSVPGVLAMVVFQGACLGLQDAKTPMLIYFIIAIINSIGDAILTLWLSWGVTGAALATLAAQTVGCILFFLHFFRKKNHTASMNSIHNVNKKNTSKRNDQTNLYLHSVDDIKDEIIPLPVHEVTFLEGEAEEERGEDYEDEEDQSMVDFADDVNTNQFNLNIGWYGFPDKNSLKFYMDMALPLVLRCSLGMAVYSILTKVSSNIGILELASHQVALQLFWTIGFFPEPLSISAQSLIARDMIENPKGVYRIAQKLVTISLLLGLLLAMAVFCITFFAHSLLTSDAVVANMIISILPQGILCQIFCAVSITIEGIGIGSGQYSYFPFLQFSVLALSMVFLFVSQRLGLGLGGVWWTLVFYLFIRTVGHIIYICVHRKTHVLGGKSFEVLA